MGIFISKILSSWRMPLWCLPPEVSACPGWKRLGLSSVPQEFWTYSQNCWLRYQSWSLWKCSRNDFVSSCSFGMFWNEFVFCSCDSFVAVWDPWCDSRVNKRKIGFLLSVLMSHHWLEGLLLMAFIFVCSGFFWLFSLVSFTALFLFLFVSAYRGVLPTAAYGTLSCKVN